MPWTTLPSMQRLSPSGLMINPQSCATVNLRAQTFPVRRSISTSATIATTAPERWARLPLGALGRRLDHGDVARRLQIAQPKSDRVGSCCRGDLVDKGFAGE